MKIKWLKNENASYSDRKKHLYLLITEAIRSFFDYLTQEEARNLLIYLKELGFESSAQFLKDFLTSTGFKTIQIENFSNTFNHDVFFQLNECGDMLKRTLNSKPDPRVKFQPDKWQRDLLDIVDRNESALICKLNVCLFVLLN